MALTFTIVEEPEPQLRTFPLTFSSGLFTAKHRKRMGMAIWIFGYLVDRITKEEEYKGRWVGIVSGGAPVKATDIAKHLDLDEGTVRSQLERLENKGYIRRRRTPRGYVIEVLNSKKWAFWKAGSDRGKTPDPIRHINTYQKRICRLTPKWPLL